MDKKSLRNSVLFIVLLLQTIMMTSVNAEIFKCTNGAGEVYYNDKPCPVLDKEKKMRSEKDVANGYAPPVVINKSNKSRQAVRKPQKGGTIDFKKSTKKKSKMESAGNKSKLLIGSRSGSKSNSRSEKTSDNQVLSQPKTAPKGNYSERKRTIEDKRAYLGIRKQVE
ncbi:MAG: hypothetical protein V3U78_03250 [Thiotrichaceae bacterium]